MKKLMVIITTLTLSYVAQAGVTLAPAVIVKGKAGVVYKLQAMPGKILPSAKKQIIITTGGKDYPGTAFTPPVTSCASIETGGGVSCGVK